MGARLVVVLSGPTTAERARIVERVRAVDGAVPIRKVQSFCFRRLCIGMMWLAPRPMGGWSPMLFADIPSLFLARALVLERLAIAEKGVCLRLCRGRRRGVQREPASLLVAPPLDVAFSVRTGANSSQVLGEAHG